MYTVLKKLLTTAIVGMVIGLVWLAAAVSAQEATPAPEPSPDCAECHIDVVATWQTSIHAQAYHDENFQSAWQTQGENPECLACHTTGFVPFSGQFDQPGVSCAACHGETPANHPPEPVLVDPGVEVCATCHTTTFGEWQMSAHGEQQLACTACHTPHDQHIRFETVEALCINCHDEARNDYAHITHVEQVCTDCHWYRNIDESEHILTGNLLPTGHDSFVETAACVDCHAQLVEDTALVAEATALPDMMEAELRIRELETEIRTIQAQNVNQAAIYSLQGLLLVGVVVVMGGVGFVRLRRNGR